MRGEETYRCSYSLDVDLFVSEIVTRELFDSSYIPFGLLTQLSQVQFFVTSHGPKAT